MAYCPPQRIWGLKTSAIAGIVLATVAATVLLMQMQPPAHLAADQYRTPAWAIILHVGTVLPALALGAVVLARRKGDRRHRLLGRVWMATMIVTAITSFWIRGPSGGLSGIHLFSIGTLIAIPVALWRIRQRDVQAHQQIMVSLYIGLIVAGTFALAPDRMAGRFLIELLGL